MARSRAGRSVLGFKLGRVAMKPSLGHVHGRRRQRSPVDGRGRLLAGVEVACKGRRGAAEVQREEARVCAMDVVRVQRA